MSVLTGTARATPLWQRISMVALVVSLVAGVALHPMGGIDPVRSVISDGVASPAGAALLMLSVLSLTVVGAGLIRGVRRHRPPWTTAVDGLLGLWIAGLLLVAFFPPNLPGSPADVAAGFHRIGAGILVAAPPVVGLLVAGPDRALRQVSVLAMLATAPFAAVNGPAVLMGTEQLPYVGLIERVLLALGFGVLALIPRALRARTEVPSWT